MGRFTRKLGRSALSPAARLTQARLLAYALLNDVTLEIWPDGDEVASRLAASFEWLEPNTPNREGWMAFLTSWAMFNMRARPETDDTVATIALARSSRSPMGPAIRYIESAHRAPISVQAVIDLGPDQGLVIRDIFTEIECFAVSDLPLARLEPGMLCIGRVMESAGKFAFETIGPTSLLRGVTPHLRAAMLSIRALRWDIDTVRAHQREIVGSYFHWIHLLTDDDEAPRFKPRPYVAHSRLIRRSYRLLSTERVKASRCLEAGGWIPTKRIGCSRARITEALHRGSTNHGLPGDLRA